MTLLHFTSSPSRFSPLDTKTSKCQLTGVFSRKDYSVVKCSDDIYFVMTQPGMENLRDRGGGGWRRADSRTVAWLGVTVVLRTAAVS